MKLNVESQEITLLSVPIINQNAIVFLRRVVAFSLALTLIFTPIDFLITPSAVNLDPFKCENTIQRLLFFCVIPENYLIFGKWIAVALCFFVFPGKFPFISNLILFWISGTLFHMAPTSDGGEQIALCLSTMLLTFSVGGLMTSIPCKLVNIEKYAASWFFVWHMMIKIQMFVVYFQAGVSKLAVESWTDGSEIYYDMINPMFGASGWRLEFSLFFVSNSFLLLVLTWGAIFCEIFISFAIFGSDNVKIIAIIFAIILHTSIAFFLGITSFSIIMIGGAIYSLLPDRFAYERGVFSDDEKLDS